MHPFAYRTAASPGEAVAQGALGAHVAFVAGGTDLLQLMKERVSAPSALVDLNALPFRDVRVGEGGVHVGALARMSDVAAHPAVAEGYPALARALLESASPQVRNLATMGGNLLQRTRCLYFRDASTPCNKREPGTGCSALEGMNRINAILGTSEHCIAEHPSDLAVALAALDASVLTLGPAGEREIPLADLHREPGDAPHVETVLEPGELITEIRVPASALARNSTYVKVRDRASFEWALVSAAVALDIADGRIRQARVAVGGVATKPWRLPRVEGALVGEAPGTPAFERAAGLASEGAVPRGHNGFKLRLLERTVARALALVGEEA